MEKSKIIGYILLLTMILSSIILKGDIQFYTMLIAVILVLPYFVFKLVKTFKNNPQEKRSMSINLILIIIFLIVGYLVITQRFKL